MTMRLDNNNVSLAEFETAHANNFAPLLSVITMFTEQHGLRLSRSFDRDPLGTEACYFCGWPFQNNKPDHRFIRICVQDPFEPGVDFYIDAIAKRFAHQRWTYSTKEGKNRLMEILLAAKSFLDQQSDVQ